MNVSPFIEGDFYENGPYSYKVESDSELSDIPNGENENEQDIKKVKRFGLHKYGGEYYFGYYIGLGWFDNDQTQAIYVHPKIKKLDYNQMFMSCLQSPKVRRELSPVYDVRLEEKFIIPPQENRVNLLPIIINHYLFLLKDLIKKPLIKAYINRQENLKAKIKGKIMVSRHIKKNISNYRQDRIMCSFDEYSPDCPANRLLHSAYKKGMQYLKDEEQTKKPFAVEYSSIEKYFAGIGYLHSYSETAKIKTNPLYTHYKEPLRLAKIIYRYFTYQYETNNNTARVNKPMPPFIIDMAKLFELYVYTKLLKTGHSIEFQFNGHGGIPDFIDTTENSKMIIDAKYKENYNNYYELPDIRQLSGYARDTRILKKLLGNNFEDPQGKWDTILDCLIIYPANKDSGGLSEIPKDFSLEMKKEINEFHKFYKLGITLPEK